MVDLVTGISQTSQPARLEDSLCKDNAIDCNKLSVITKDAPSREHEDSVLTFIHASESHNTTDTSSAVTSGYSGILTNIDGVNVPGISSDTRYVSFFASPHVINHLADWAIPSDRIDNYNEAIQAGRSVVTYRAALGEAAGIEKAFRNAGLSNVSTFPGEMKD